MSAANPATSLSPHEQEFGFTREMLGGINVCIASAPGWDEHDERVYVCAWLTRAEMESMIAARDRIEALLPPEESR